MFLGKEIMSFLIPILMALFVLLIWHGLGECVAEFGASCGEVAVSLDMVEVKTTVKLAVAHRTQI